MNEEAPPKKKGNAHIIIIIQGEFRNKGINYL